jgi:4-hydroxybenzoate polyprenyltransferase
LTAHVEFSPGLVAAGSGGTSCCGTITGLCIGIVYSVPPFRLRRSAVGASLMMVLGRGVLLNLLIAAAVIKAATGNCNMPIEIVAFSAFISLLTLILSIYKDLIDIRGDRHDGIRTLPVKFGIQAVRRTLAFSLFFLLVAIVPSAAAFGLRVHIPTLALGELLSASLFLAIFNRNTAFAREAAGSNAGLDQEYKAIWSCYMLVHIVFLVSLYAYQAT